MRWSPDSRSWQNSNGSCAEHVSYRVAGSHSVAIASGLAEQCPGLADGTPVTATVGNGGLTPSDLGVVEEWLAFNASVRRAGERKGCLSFSSRGGLERDGDDSPRSRVGSLPSSEAETRGAVEGLDGSP